MCNWSVLATHLKSNVRGLN